MPLKFSKLNRPELRKLASGQKVTEHGITFERLSNGDGVYSVNIMVDGQRIHRVIGRESDGTTRTQAEEFIEKVKRDAKDGRLNLPKGRKLTFSFKEAGIKYLEKLESEDGKNLRIKHLQMKLHLIPFFGQTPLGKVSSSDIEQYKKLRQENNVQPSTINRELATISHLFNKAMEWQWLDKRPASIKRLKENQSKITYLTSEQASRILEVAKKDQNPQIYLFIVIGLETAMRRMEILSIKLENIDLEHRIIHIPKAKAGSRQQPITNRLAAFWLNT